MELIRLAKWRLPILNLAVDPTSLKELIQATVAEALAQSRSADAPERWLQIPQVSEILGLGDTKVRELISQGRLRSVLVDSSRRIPQSAVKEFQAQIADAARRN